MHCVYQTPTLGSVLLRLEFYPKAVHVGHAVDKETQNISANIPFSPFIFKLNPHAME